MKDMKAALAVLMAGVAWGIISLFSVPLRNAGLAPMQIAGARMIAAGLSSVLILLIMAPGKLKIRPQDLWLFFCTGIVCTIMYAFCYFHSMSHGQNSVAIVLLYSSTGFVMIMAAIFFRERITKIKLISLVLTVVGCILVAGMLDEEIHVPAIAVISGVASGFFYALYTIFGRLALRKYDSLTVTAWTFIFAMLGSFVVAEPSKTVGVLALKPSLMFYVLGIGFVCSVLPVFLYTWGLERMDAGKAAILVALEPVIGAILGMTVYHEPHNLTKLVGIVLVFIAIVILNIDPKKRSASNAEQAD